MIDPADLLAAVQRGAAYSIAGYGERDMRAFRHGYSTAMELVYNAFPALRDVAPDELEAAREKLFPF